MTELKQCSIAHEYYHGDLPGSLQYNKTPEELIAIPNLDHVDPDNNYGYFEILPKQDLKNQLIPDTDKGRSGNWKLLVLFKKTIGDKVWLKGALLNIDTGRIALMTSTNREENITEKGNRAMKSRASGWYVGQYRMCAPMNFWRAVAAQAQCLVDEQ